MSKSVRLISNAAKTGRKKNTPMTSKAGATNHHAARSNLNHALRAQAASGAFRESCRRARRAPSLPDPRKARRVPRARRRLDAFQLVTEGARIDIVGDRPVGPGGASRREISGELMKTSLDSRLR